MSLLIFFIISYVLLSASLYKLFVKAGEEGWKALVPGLNFVVWCKLIGQPTWWAALLLIPIVNIFIYAGMCVDMVRSFGRFKFMDSFLAVVYAPIIFFMIGMKEEDKYLGKTVILEKEYADKIQAAVDAEDQRAYQKLVHTNPYKKSQPREWAEAIFFAVFAAAFIRMFLIEAYVIPTPSMEGSLLVGDFMFVSKAHYGIRTPMTVAQFPLIHNTIPVLGGESYLKKPSLGYHRLPAINDIERNDPVVFNYPEGDSVYMFPGRTMSIYDLRRRNALNQAKGLKLRVRSIDKKDHYIKRCIAVAGDEVQIIDKQVHINGKAVKNPDRMQFRYEAQVASGGTVNANKLDDLSVNLTDINTLVQNRASYLHLNDEQRKAVEEIGGITLTPSTPAYRPLDLFPHDPENFGSWTMDNFGPLKIPKKGESVVITPKNIALYKRVIDVYEDNDLQIKNGRIFINGEQATEYTFKQDYFWMMGDNRHNSEDSRVWGFVPHDHVVGKPLFIWFSTKNGSIFNGINWGRIFSGARKME